MGAVDASERRERRRKLLQRLWQQYGLIVVGNVVFFALLYFVQYRPNSGENRAMELLTLAQREEADGRLQAAESLYAKIVSGYEDSGAAVTAKERLPKVQALAKRQREVQPPLPAACAPSIQLAEVLEVRPSLYLAELIAGNFPSVQTVERDRYFRVLDGYVWIALNRDGVPLETLRKSAYFRAAELHDRYFPLKVAVQWASDWIYDDFKLKNMGFFTLHNAVIDVTVSQGNKSEHVSLRQRSFAPEAVLDLLEFNVGKHAGPVQVRGTIVSDEGKLDWQQRL